MINKPKTSPDISPARQLVKGWDIVNVTVEPGRVREARDAEPHVAAVSATFIRVARDGADVFKDDKQATAHFDEPAVVSAARALLSALTEVAARKVNGPVFVQHGPDATTDYVSIT